VFDVQDGVLELTELAPGISLAYVTERTGASFKVRPGVGDEGG
jgi:acyl CoA:acetate/3-ketoacid CoA transferase beta subunit